MFGKMKMSLVATCLLAGYAGTTFAETTTYELLVFEDTVQGRLISKGKVDKAMAMMTDAEKQSFHRANNYCVMMTMEKSFDLAIPSCNSAIDSASEARIRAHAGSVASEAAAEREALALSNRGVAKALSGDSIGAKNDFTKALELNDSVDAIEANLALLESKLSMSAPIAQAGE